MSKLLASSRQRSIIKDINKYGHKRVLELAKIYHVSDETIRNDLRCLMKNGLIRKVHGGAESLNISQLSSKTPLITNLEIIDGIIPHIKPHAIIYLDSDSLAENLATKLPQLPLTIYTSSLNIITILKNRLEITLICLGGKFDPITKTFKGEESLPLLNYTKFDLAIFTCTKIDDTLGPLTNDADKAQKLRNILTHCEKNIVIITPPEPMEEPAHFALVTQDQQSNTIILHAKKV